MTCIEMDRLHTSTRQALADCCDMHRNIMRLFPSPNSGNIREEEQVLYRVVEHKNALQLYVTSRSKPDLAEARWLKGESCRQRDMQPLLDAFADDQVYSFDLLAHPSKKMKGEGKNSTRVFLRTPEERAQWLHRQGEKYGFRIAGLREEEPYDLSGKRSTGIMLIRAIRFCGQLQVTDAEAFRLAYQNGIGAEKAYGLGMLMLSRG